MVKQEVWEQYNKNRKRIGRLWHTYTSVEGIRRLLWMNEEALTNDMKRLGEPERGHPELYR